MLYLANIVLPMFRSSADGVLITSRVSSSCLWRGVLLCLFVWFCSYSLKLHSPLFHHLHNSSSFENSKNDQFLNLLLIRYEVTLELWKTMRSFLILLMWRLVKLELTVGEKQDPRWLVVTIMRIEQTPFWFIFSLI